MDLSDDIEGHNKTEELFMWTFLPGFRQSTMDFLLWTFFFKRLCQAMNKSIVLSTKELEEVPSALKNYLFMFINLF